MSKPFALISSCVQCNSPSIPLASIVLSLLSFPPHLYWISYLISFFSNCVSPDLHLHEFFTISSTRCSVLYRTLGMCRYFTPDFNWWHFEPSQVKFFFFSSDYSIMSQKGRWNGSECETAYVQIVFCACVGNYTVNTPWVAGVCVCSCSSFRTGLYESYLLIRNVCMSHSVAAALLRTSHSIEHRGWDKAKKKKVV